MKASYAKTLFWVAVVLLCALRSWHLTADFPNHSPWMIDQAKFTDEGWWASAAVNHHLTGHWTIPGDYNPGVAVPVWPLLVALLFHWTGISLVAVRALNVLISLATIGVVFLLVCRLVDASSKRPAMLATLLVASSPFAFVFSRLGTLDTFVIFQFCLMMLVASFIEKNRFLILAVLTLLATTIVFTKTTAVLFLPGVFCLAWMKMNVNIASGIQMVVALGVIPALLFIAYKSVVKHFGFWPDYEYFFDVNAMSDIDWGQALPTIGHLLRNCFLIDRFVYPLSVVALISSMAWLRNLWKNPLFVASWVMIACQVCFIFRRQDDYAPRYLLGMLLPMIFVIALSVDAMHVRYRKLYPLAVLTIAVVVGINTVSILRFRKHSSYQFYAAALFIKEIVRSSSNTNPLMLGVSASQLSVMTGIPSINDAYGTQELGDKISRYKPGWFVVWNSIGKENKDALPPFQLERVARYPVFDDEDRNELILYRIKRK